ncbi:MAG TPA: hypothetical protein PKA06_15795 [Gemmatales bacterium]|nr:hypothetical protein [Gemmatales bacterium]HMP15718.1 hypothetical protein [Gemmatales bacterium]
MNAGDWLSGSDLRRRAVWLDEIGSIGYSLELLILDDFSSSFRDYLPMLAIYNLDIGTQRKVLSQKHFSS